MSRLDFNIVRVSVNVSDLHYDSSLAVHANRVIHGDLTGVRVTLADSFHVFSDDNVAKCTHSCRWNCLSRRLRSFSIVLRSCEHQSGFLDFNVPWKRQMDGPRAAWRVGGRQTYTAKQI